MAILWLGVRGNAALFVVSYAATFPFIVSASQAVRIVDRRLVDAARALGASRWIVLRAVLMPSTLPMLFTGARIALAFAWGSIIAAELAIGIKIAGQGRNVAGIGQLMVETLYVKRDVDALVFYMLAIGIVSLAIDAGPAPPSATVAAMGSPMNPLIELRNLGKTYASARTGEPVEALADIDLSLRRGEFLAVVGPSGCGKSTLLSLVAGFAKPTRGEVLFEGAPVTGPGPERGVMFQDYALFPWRTVHGNVVFGPWARGVAPATRDQRARELIAMVGLTGFEHRYPHELSGGMRQRCRARANARQRPGAVADGRAARRGRPADPHHPAGRAVAALGRRAIPRRSGPR
jgi:ABC-type lipoprotein export system ATPase subunit